MQNNQLRTWIAVLLSGLLTIAIFPGIDIGWIGYICFIPLLLLVEAQTPRKLFLYFYVSGLLFNLGNLYWIVLVIGHYTALNPFFSSGVLILLCLLMAIFWGVFGLVLGFFRRRVSFARAMLLAPFLWIVLEWIRNYTTHFPWCLLGYSQYKYLQIAQLATFFGVYGLSLLVMAVNAALTTAIVRRKYYYASSMAIVILALFFYGNGRIHTPVGKGALSVGLIQGNVPQDIKMDFNYVEQISQTHVEMTRKLIKESKPQLIFWPEASVLFPLRSGGEWSRRITSMAAEANTPILVGSDSFLEKDIYNSAFLIDTKGEIAGQYDKIYLVPFGEYVPLKWLFRFAGKVVPEISDFASGQHYNTFTVYGKQFSVAICFEVVFPQLTREFCARGSSLLSTITNDAWFGKTSAPYQHWAMSVMRAIEHRRYLVRAANTGISGIVDPYGRVLQQTDIFVPAILAGKIEWIDENTFYTRHGDILIYISILIITFGLVYPKRRLV